MVTRSAWPLLAGTFLLPGTEHWEPRYLLLFAGSCWHKHHGMSVIYHLHIYLHLCLKKSGNLPDLEVLNRI